MSIRYYHTPPKQISTRVHCPVCHQDVYSNAGIHPQCAVRQADPPRMKVIKTDVLAAAGLEHLPKIVEHSEDGVDPRRSRAAKPFTSR
ncbi:MAG: hypothetical protein NVSMB9_30120 [Isosphaeraceae bacterium]